MKSFLLVVTLAATWLAISHAQAARIITAQFNVDGERVLETYYADDGSPTPNEVLWYLATPPNSLNDEEVKIAPLADNPLEAELAGEVVVTLKNGRGSFRTDKLRLVRDSAEEENWYLPREELERVESQILRSRPVTPPQPAGSLGAVSMFGLAGGLAVLVLLAIALVAMFMPRGSSGSP